LYWLTLLLPLSAMLIPAGFSRFTTRYLTVRGNALYILGFGSTVVLTMAAVVVVFAVCNRIAETIISSPRVNPRGINAQLIRIASKLISVVLASVAFMVGGQYLGIPIATLLASAGIGGIALALGAQDTLRTLFGTIMLMADKPFRVGERIVFKGYDGVVEDIGLRSTRLRLLSSHQVSVPNDQLAGSDIENVGRRERIRRVIDFQIPNNTPSSSLESAVELIRDLLDQHEGMHEDFPPRVFFVDFLPEAFTIRVMYWYHPPNYWDFLAFSEQLNFAIFRAFEDRGIKFSLPQRVTHTSLDSEQAPIDIRMIEPKG
jgi:MscS family membrane protein